MDKEAILKELKRYVVDELLEGKDDGLEETTPLLALGVLNSLEVARMLRFIQRKYGAAIRLELVRVEDLETLAAIANMVHRSLPVTSG
jgi:clorobiocin biosynthesis protein CloN5